MAMTIKQLLNSCWMSQASYLNFTGLAQNDQQALRNDLQNSTINASNIFTTAQAAVFTDLASGFGFTSYRPNDSSGFSATVFKANSALNDYTIAVRGTEPFGNPIADLINADVLGVGLQGAAYDQAISAYRYYKQLTTTNGHQVSYTAAELTKLGALYNATLLTLPNPILDAVVRAVRVSLFRTSLTDAANPDNLGLGAIDPATAQIHFTGHSLGGHVATLLAAMVQQFHQGNVADVLTYNAPGQGGVFRVNTLVDATPIAGKITDVIGEGGMTFTADMGNYIGTRDRIFIEVSSTNPIDNHYIVKLSDSLTLYDLFATLDPSLNTVNPVDGIAKVARIFDATSNIGTKTLEAVISKLGTLFAVPGLTFIGNEFDTDRDKLYTSVSSLKQALQGGGSVASLADLSAAQIASVADAPAEDNSDQAYRYALKALNPFAITGATALYAPFNTNGELNLYEADTGAGTLTKRWLEDRAKFLTTKIGINTNDQLFALNTLNPGASKNTWYKDLALGDNAYVLTSSGRGLRNAVSVEALLKKTEAQRVFFGFDIADPSLTGGANADSLYGNGGDDRLSGLGGNDYLQGDAGWDRLYGGDGNDQLVGGKDKDLLIGGSGNDTYVWNTGDGIDTIVDSDGQGKIMFAGVDLTGVYERKGQDEKTFGNADFTITWNGKLAVSGSPEGTGWLTIAKDTDPSGAIRILGFDSSTTFLGINLNGVPSNQVFTNLDGTIANDTLAADAPFQEVFGLAGNDWIVVATAGAVAYGGAGMDVCRNGAGDQKLYGDAGNDILVASEGNDELYGGLDNDALQGGADDDYLEGNDGNDVLDGGAGSDVLVGGEGSDFLLGGGSIVPYFLSAWDPNDVPDFGVLVDNGVAGLNNMVGFLNIEGDAADVLDGGAGNDTLFAGDGDDLLKGGADNDLLDGQAGNDTLEGGDGVDYLYGDGSQGGVTVGGQDIYTLPEFHGDDYLDGGAGNDFLVGDGGSDELYGGEGNDILVGDESGLAEQYHGADYLDGGAGDDQLFGYGKDDMLIGGAGNDMLEGDSDTVAFDKHGSDYLDGGDGNDVLKGDGGGDTLFGGAGNDQLFGDTDDTPAQYQGDDYLDGEAGDDYLRGYGGSDTLFGGDGADQLLGEAGNDYLDGEAGDDLMSGGEGNDELFGGDGADDLQGDAGDDYLEGEDGNDLLSGGSGNDQLLGDAGNDQLAGDDGDDVLDAGAGDDTLFGDAGNDSLSGDDGNDALLGGSGNDGLSGGAGNDQLGGDDGDDVVDGGVGDDLLFGDAGNDTLTGAAGVDQIQGGDGNDTASGGEGDDIVLGQAGDDVLAGDDGDDELQGGAGDDQLDGGAGDDRLYGDEGNDVLIGSDGANYFAGGAGNDYLIGGTGSDVFYWEPGDGIDTIHDISNKTVGANTNTLLFGPGVTWRSAPSLGENIVALRLGSLMLDFGNGDAIHLDNFDPDNVAAGAGIDQFEFQGGFTLSYKQLIAQGFDLTGTPDADVIYGTSASDRINALAGDDVVIAKRGEDVIDLGAGDDYANAGDGNDVVFGGDGTDRVYGGAGDDVLDGGAGDDQLFGEAGNDDLDGGDGNDALAGGTGDDVLYGGAGDDQLFGEAGNDELDGGDGNDTLAGGAGDDVYFVDAGDSVVEAADEGYDVVNADFSATLGANLEELDLIGTDNIDGTGNELDNVIAGNEGDNVLLGLAGNDTIYGNDGNDTLDGGTGGDFLAGGSGDDLYIVDSADDVVAEAQDLYNRDLVLDGFGNVIQYGALEFSGGYDMVESSVSFGLDQWTEDLVLTGNDAIDGVGNVESNYIEGNDADNALYAYRSNGQADLYPTGIPFIQQFTVDRNAAEEMLADKANAAIFRGETKWSSPLSVDLYSGDGDTLVGNGGNDRLYGGLDNDVLIGGDGNDLLYGFAGADYMEGGAGDDTYVVSGAYDFSFGYHGGDHLSYSNASADELYEAADEGTDTIVAEVDFALPENFENLTLVYDTRDYDPDGAISTLRFGRPIATVGEGNELDNVITANDAGNELYGYGGADTLIGGAGNDYLDGGEGADTLRGGAGDDRYAVDNAGDLVIEDAGGGHDTVHASIDYTLSANVEDLYLDGATYTENLSGSGNELDNLIVGNDGDNVLLGLAGNDVLDGGAGNDVMDGGAGDDSYYVDSESDVTTESADQGHDSVYASVSHLLGDNIEDLTLTGSDDISGEGNALDNLIVGNDGSNYLGGYAGDDLIEGNGGDDELYGDAGNDVLRGGDGDDYMSGGDGNDVLDGGAASDTMEGGAGDDSYYVDTWGDQVYEAPGEGHDTVNSTIDFSLPDDVEDLTLVGDFQGEMYGNGLWGDGNDLDNRIIGSDTSNSLSGQGGDDFIDGRADSDYINGGDGNDTLYGGDDTVFVEDIETPVWNGEEQVGSIGTHIEILASNDDRLYGDAGNDAIDGGSGNDDIYGGEGDNHLYGGDDGIAVAGERYYEANGEVGSLYAAVSGGDPTDTSGQFYYNNTNFYQLDIAGPLFLGNDDYIDGGGGNDVIDGGSGNDYLYGGDGDDTLFGGADGPLNTSNNDTLDGGAGIDTMAGGTGDDVYYVDGSYTETTDIPVYGDCGELIPGAVTRVWTTDTVFENADEGNDTVYSYADYTLPDNVENLYLQWYSAAQLGRGNALDNSIYGNNNDNRLEGGAGDDYLDGGWGNDVLDGGAGNDVLIGGAGDDVYNLGFGAGRDTVSSYGGGFDTVHVLNQLGAGDVSLSRSGDDVSIALTGTDDRMVLSNWFASGERVSEIDFCDGTSLDENQIADLANAHMITAVTDYAEVQEDGVLLATGNVLDNDSDSLGHAMAVVDPATVAGAYGTLTLAADGSYSYALANDAVQWLAEGESVSEGFGYEVGDAGLAYGYGTLDVAILGQNDAPLTSPASGEVVEDGNPGMEIVPGDNVVVNSSFDNADLSGWDISNSTGSIGSVSPAHSSPSAAFFGWGVTDGRMSQDVPTVEGQHYTVDFWLSNYGFNTTNTEFDASWNGATLLSLANPYLPDYTEYQFDVVGTAGSSHLEFAVRSDMMLGLDDVTVSPYTTQEVVPTTQSAAGVLAFSDADLGDWHDISVQPQAADYLGSFDAQLAQDSAGSGTGSIAWNFLVGDSDIDYLSEGQTLTQNYDVTIDDGHAGGSVTQTVAVNIIGTNDAPTITYADDSGAVVEDQPVSDDMGDLVVPAAETASGEIDFADVDLADVHSVTVQAADAGYVGSLDAAVSEDSTGYGDGWLDWTFAVDNSAIDYLAEGEELEQTYDVTVSDGYAAATQSVTVTVTGANDAPVVAAAFGAVTEDAVPAAGLVAGDNLLANGGFENGDLSGWSLAGSTDQVGVDNLSFDGGYAGLFGAIGADAILGQDVQTTAGQQYLLDFRLMGGGEQGADFSVSWNGATLAALADVSLPDYTEFQYVVSGADGLSQLEFALRDDPDFWRLDAITLQPLLPGVLVPQQESTSGSIAFTDPDLSDVHDMEAEAAGPDYLGDFSFGEMHDSTGTGSGSIDWSFTVEDSAIQYLAEGESLTQYYDVAVYDDYTSGMGTPGVTVTINGANDAPEITYADASGGVVEDAMVLDDQGNSVVPPLQTMSGELNFSDVDRTDTHSLTVQAAAAGYVGSLDAQLIHDSTGTSDGRVQWRFAAGNSDLDYLAQGDLLEQTYNVIVDDGHTGGTATQTVTVSILGANDAPVTQDDAAGVQEDVALSATGNVLANDNDPDHGTVLSVAAPGPLTGDYGTLKLAADGAYSYALDNNLLDVQALRAGQTVTDVFGYDATDGIMSTHGMLTLTVIGTNDAPLALDDAGAAGEDGGAVTLSGALLLANDTDIDAGDTKTITAVTNSAAGALVNLAGGNLVYDVGTLFQTLMQGATTTDAFTYTMADGAGAASSATVTMTVTGVNDAPIVANPIADQSATAGSPFSFSVAANTFFDIDAGDSLAYTATLADGTALPSWLAFDAATCTFTGTPPGGTGTGGDCGTGTASSLQLRVDATDTAGASASDLFALNIAGGGGSGGGRTIIGTDHDDLLSGTPCDDVIDGRKGFDKMSGGKGDDVYYVDATCGRVDQVVENANEGYDTVYSSADYTLSANVEELHLIGCDDLSGQGNALDNIVVGNSGDNALDGAAGDDLLMDDAGNDALYGGTGNDVLDGGAGNDALQGGAGDDIYVHGLGGGDDVVQESGGQDTIRFGDGIAASAVSVLRSRDDLVLKLSGQNGSVTVKNWFSGSAGRVERVQFADGSAWNETQMRARVGQSSGGGAGDGQCSDPGRGDGRHSSGQNQGDSGHGVDRHDDSRRDDSRREDSAQCCDARDAIAARLAQSPNYDFTALTTYLAQHQGGGYGALTAAQVAAQWRSVQDRVAQLAQDDEDSRHGAHGGEHYGGDDGLAHGAMFWGYAGATGQNRGCGGMATFGGLDEGFRKLG